MLFRSINLSEMDLGSVDPVKCKFSLYNCEICDKIYQ